jgi:hypothetical protein
MNTNDETAPAYAKKLASRPEPRRITPRPGAQTRFLASQADLALWVGEWMVGKTTGLLLDWLRHVNTPNACGLVLMARASSITVGGGLFDEARELYDGTGVNVSTGAQMRMKWPGGAVLTFRSVDSDRTHGNAFDWIGVDHCEETDWTDLARWLTRNRSTGGGIRPTMRLAGYEAPRGLGGPLTTALNRDPKTWPGPGASWLARSRRCRTEPMVFGPTRDATAEIAGCSPEHVMSFELITG